jgi:hypothetical protein
MKWVTICSPRRILLMTTNKTMSKEDLQTYLNYVLTNEVKDEKHAKELSRLSKRTVTLSDVTVLFKVLNNATQQQMTQMMDVIQIQNRILDLLGATEEMFTQAEDEYNEQLNAMRKQLQEEYGLGDSEEVQEETSND